MTVEFSLVYEIRIQMFSFNRDSKNRRKPEQIACKEEKERKWNLRELRSERTWSAYSPWIPHMKVNGCVNRLSSWRQ